MIIVKYNEEKHLEIIKSWANERGLEIVPILLSQNGYVVEENDLPIMAIWLYTFTDVPVVQLDHFIASPHNHPKTTIKAWKALFHVINEHVKIYEKLSGIKIFMIRCMIREELAKVVKRYGFIVDKNEGVICRLIKQ